MAQELLEAEGAQVALADNGRAGVDAVTASEAPFDAVLMDLQMPVMDGYEAVRRLRQMPAYDALPVLAMTAKHESEDREACLQAGMQGVIHKPLNAAQAMAIITETLVASASGVAS